MKRINRAKATNTKEKSMLSNIMEFVSAAKEHFDKLQKGSTDIDGEIKTKAKFLESLKSKVDQKTKVFEDFIKLIAESEVKYKEITTKLNETKKELEKENKKVENKKNESREIVVKTAKELDKVTRGEETKRDEIKKELALMENSLGDRQQKLAEVTKLINTIHNSVVTKKEENKVLELQIEEKIVKIKGYDDMFEQKYLHFVEIDKKNADLQIELETERSVLQKTIKENAEKEKELKEKNKNLEEVQREMFALVKREKRVNQLVPELKKLAQEAGYNLKI